jgi:L-ornithine N5-oxygenase
VTIRPCKFFHRPKPPFPRKKTPQLTNPFLFLRQKNSVNEVFNPERVSDIYSQSPSIRSKLIAHDKATNYGVVRLELLEEIYAQQYAYKIQRLPETSWPHRILPHRKLVAVGDIPTGTTGKGQGGLRLELQDDSHLYHAGRATDLEREVIDADLVIVATGYQRNAHEEMLAELREFMPSGPSGPTDSPLQGSTEEKKWSVSRNYAVQFEPGTVAADAGIYLQGCNEATHGLADSLLSILSVRGGEIVETVFGADKGEKGDAEVEEGRSVCVA